MNKLTWTDFLILVCIEVCLISGIAFWKMYLDPRGWVLIDSHGSETLWWGLCPNPENPTALKVWITAAYKNYERLK